MSVVSKSEAGQLVEAIRKSEARTSGEIKVHIEKWCPGDVHERCLALFEQLGLHLTAERNGILIYLAAKDHQFYILGDSGIHTKVGQSYWDDVVAEVLPFFRRHETAKGLIRAIELSGEKLVALFPPRADDTNELSDEISLG